MIYRIDRGCDADVHFRVNDVEFDLVNDYAGWAEVNVNCDYDTDDADKWLFCADWDADALRFMAEAFNEMADKLEKYI
jgi:hypothetical protein